MGMRETDQADFDLERFINMFDEAMTSKDPRVVETLRSLLMIVTLTRPEANDDHGRSYGPLRRLFDDMHNLNRSVSRMQEEINDLRFKERSKSYNSWDDPNAKYTMAASSQMAQQIDADVLRQLNKEWVQKINGGIVPQNLKLPTKGIK